MVCLLTLLIMHFSDVLIQLGRLVEEALAERTAQRRGLGHVGVTGLQCSHSLTNRLTYRADAVRHRRLLAESLLHRFLARHRLLAGDRRRLWLHDRQCLVSEYVATQQSNVLGRFGIKRCHRR